MCVRSAAPVGTPSLGPRLAGRLCTSALLLAAATCVTACGRALWRRRWHVLSLLFCSVPTLGGRALWLPATSGCCSRPRAALGCVHACGSSCVLWLSLPLIGGGGTCGRAGVSGSRGGGPACGSSPSWRRGAVSCLPPAPLPLWCSPPAWRWLTCGAVCVMWLPARPSCPSPGPVGSLGTRSLSWCPRWTRGA